jgi:Flp pilus assembly pilin Flp
MGHLFRRFIVDQSGVAAIEYGLIAGLIAVVIITSVRLECFRQILDHSKRSDLRTPALPAMAASPAPWQAPMRVRRS